jgi:hypothetical protein
MSVLTTLSLLIIPVSQSNDFISLELRVRQGTVCNYESELSLSYFDAKTKKAQKQALQAKTKIVYGERIGSSVRSFIESTTTVDKAKPTKQTSESLERVVGDPTVTPAEQNTNSEYGLSVNFPGLGDWRPGYVFRVGQRIYLPIESSRFEISVPNDDVGVDLAFFNSKKTNAVFRIAEITASEVKIEASYTLDGKFETDKENCVVQVRNQKQTTFRRSDGLETQSSDQITIQMNGSKSGTFTMSSKRKLISETFLPTSQISR